MLIYKTEDVNALVGDALAFLAQTLLTLSVPWTSLVSGESPVLLLRILFLNALHKIYRVRMEINYIEIQLSNQIFPIIIYVFISTFKWRDTHGDLIVTII